MRQLFFLAVLAFAAPALAIDGNEILATVDRNMTQESYEMYRKLINIEPDGKRKEYVLYTAKKERDKVVALFLSPSSEKGRSTLRIGDNMWLYIPNVGKPIRITSLQLIVDGIFNNSDIMGLDYSEEYFVERVEDSKDVYTLFLKAKTGSVSYDRLTMLVDKKQMTPITIEAYAASGMLIKTLHFKKIKDLGAGFTRPSVIKTDSPLYKGYKSVMIFSQMRQKNIPDEAFTLNFLSRVNDLR